MSARIPASSSPNSSPETTQFSMDMEEETQALQTSFEKAIERGDVSVVDKLLSDVDPTVKDNWALRTAIKGDHFAAVESLLRDVRVDPTACNNEALIFAVQNNQQFLLPKLLQHPKVDAARCIQTLLHEAAKSGHKEVFSILLQLFCRKVEDPQLLRNNPLDYAKSPSFGSNLLLREAALRGHIEIVKILLEHPYLDLQLGIGDIIQWCEARKKYDIVNVIQRAIQKLGKH